MTEERKMTAPMTAVGAEIGQSLKARGLENMLRLCAREPLFNAMVYV